MNNTSGGGEGHEVIPTVMVQVDSCIVPVAVHTCHFVHDLMQVMIDHGPILASTKVYFTTIQARQLAHALLECAQHYDEASRAASGVRA